MGSPPPAGSKNEVLRFRSVRSIVIAPARTGKDRRRSRAVMATDQVKRVNRSGLRRGDRILIVVEIKLIAPKIDDTPARCSLKIVKSTAGPL